jgi:hypothetical protein
MGFNIIVARKTNDEFLDRWTDPDGVEHAAECPGDLGLADLCAYGISGARHDEDETFFKALLAQPGLEAQRNPENPEGVPFVRPRDFSAARSTAEGIARANKWPPTRMLHILDTLERRPDIWLRGSW